MLAGVHRRFRGKVNTHGDLCVALILCWGLFLFTLTVSAAQQSHCQKYLTRRAFRPKDTKNYTPPGNRLTRKLSRVQAKKHPTQSKRNTFACLVALRPPCSLPFSGRTTAGRLEETGRRRT